MTNGEQVTGTRDEHYNLVSVLYHTLQEGDTIERYISDAREAPPSLTPLLYPYVREDSESPERAMR